MSWGISHPDQTDLLIFFWNYTFQSLGILFLFPYIAVPTPKHGNEIPRSLCRNLISTSLHGNKIPTKCLGNEIPTNHSSELYTIYNPASRFSLYLATYPHRLTLLLVRWKVFCGMVHHSFSQPHLMMRSVHPFLSLNFRVSFKSSRMERLQDMMVSRMNFWRILGISSSYIFRLSSTQFLILEVFLQTWMLVNAC